jgi:hypothetical protein
MQFDHSAARVPAGGHRRAPTRGALRRRRLLPIDNAMKVLLASTAKPPPQPPTIDIVTPMLHGFLEGVVIVWPILLLVGLFGIGKLAVQVYDARRVSKAGVSKAGRRPR